MHHLLSVVEKALAPAILKAVANGDVRGASVLVKYNRSVVYSSERTDLIEVYRTAETWLADRETAVAMVAIAASNASPE